MKISAFNFIILLGFFPCIGFCTNMGGDFNIKKEIEHHYEFKSAINVKIFDIKHKVLYKKDNYPYGILLQYSYKVPDIKRFRFNMMPHPVIEFQGLYENTRQHRYTMLENTIDLADNKKIDNKYPNNKGTDFMEIGKVYNFATYIIFNVYRFSLDRYMTNRDYLCIVKEKINFYHNNSEKINHLSDYFNIKFEGKSGVKIFETKIKEKINFSLFMKGAIQENNECRKSYDVNTYKDFY